MVLPATPAARRREELERRRARLDALDRITVMERKLNGVLRIEDTGAAAAPNASPPLRGGQDLDDFARRLATDDVLLWTGWTVNRAMDDEGPIAMSITYNDVTLSIANALELGVIDLLGRTNHIRLGLLVQGTPKHGEWVRPHAEAALPASRPGV
jgi:hypothetical protein